ncbi:MAG: HAMP domain-containing protein [Caldilineae bacterium]|nr:MAG: HAMP domain-containing protein [Caldilineae bacterium]
MFTRFRTSLRYKISAQMLLLSLFPLTIVGAMVFIILTNQLGDFSKRLGQAENTLRDDVVGANLAGIADALSAETDAYLLERIKDVRRWAESPSIIEAVRHAGQAALARGLADADRPTIEAALDAQADAGFSPFFLAPDEAGQQALTDAIGFLFREQEKSRGTFIEIIVTERSGINALVTRPVTTRVHRDAPWWRDASSHGVAGIGIVDAHPDAPDSRVVLGIALPVLDPDTKAVLGVIRGTFDLSEVQLLVSRRAALIPGGNAQVFTRDGALLADTASQHDPAVLFNPAFTPQVVPQILESGISPGFLTRTDEATSTPLITGYSHTAGSDFYDERAGLSGFEGVGWSVMVSQPEETALQVLTPLLQARQTLERQLHIIRTLILGVASLTAAAGLLIALLLARGIANPLVHLSRTAERVRAGDYRTQVAVTSQDEIGLLQDTFNSMVRGLEERERMRDLFGRAVSPEVADLFVSGQLKLGGEIRHVSVLFTDIRGFTTLSEPLPPEQVIAFINEFLDEMHKAIQGVGGVVHKLGGDSIMALFGAPAADAAHPQTALRAAIHMRARLAALNARRRERGETPLRIGIGINTGPVIAGGVGSEDRLEYTVLGDTVNVAARLESLTKEFPDYDILISEATLRALPDPDRLALTDLGSVKVKGKTEPVHVFAVLNYHE